MIFWVILGFFQFYLEICRFYVKICFIVYIGPWTYFFPFLKMLFIKHWPVGHKASALVTRLAIYYFAFLNVRANTVVPRYPDILSGYQNMPRIRTKYPDIQTHSPYILISWRFVRISKLRFQISGYKNC